MPNSDGGLRGWLSPVVHLSANWISRSGVVLVTAATVFWLFFLPVAVRGTNQYPYIGILEFVLIPTIFFAGLALIPTGLLLQARLERRRGEYPTFFPPFDLRSPETKKLFTFVGITTVVNLILGAIFSYQAITFMDSVSFCGQTCHTVMQPEYSAYQNSPHSRVDCVACHIGPGASWFVKSKLSGTGQLFAVAFDTYPRPIPVPVQNLRPARETCEACHWPQKFNADRLRIIPKYADDENNSLTKTVLLMRIGKENNTAGIHGMHLGTGISIYYSPADESRQVISRVEYDDAKTGRSTVYVSADAKPGSEKLPRRLMDCMDCHNRPTHTMQLPERAIDTALDAGAISPALPWVKKEGVELLRKTYASQDAAAATIPLALEAFYRQNHAAVYAAQHAAIAQAAKTMVAIYKRNVFPQMKVTWGTYPNNIGHTDFPGCFRCHDDGHVAANGSKITQDCNACHQLLAMDEAAPKILVDLGLANGAGSQ